MREEAALSCDLNQGASEDLGISDLKRRRSCEDSSSNESSTNTSSNESSDPITLETKNSSGYEVATKGVGQIEVWEDKEGWDVESLAESVSTVKSGLEDLYAHNAEIQEHFKRERQKRKMSQLKAKVYESVILENELAAEDNVKDRLKAKKRKRALRLARRESLNLKDALLEANETIRKIALQRDKLQSELLRAQFAGRDVWNGEGDEYSPVTVIGPVISEHAVCEDLKEGKQTETGTIVIESTFDENFLTDISCSGSESETEEEKKEISTGLRAIDCRLLVLPLILTILGVTLYASNFAPLQLVAKLFAVDKGVVLIFAILILGMICWLSKKYLTHCWAAVRKQQIVADQRVNLIEETA